MATGLSDYGQHSILLMLLPFQQSAVNLLGYAEDILLINQGPLLKLRSKLGWKHGCGGSGEFSEASLRMQMALYCEEFELATSLMSYLKENTPSVTVSLWPDQQRTFFFCLLEIHTLKTSRSKNIFWRRSKHQEIKKLHCQMQALVLDNGSINSAHKLLILDAEMQAFSTRSSWDTEKLEHAYDKAISASTKGTDCKPLAQFIS